MAYSYATALALMVCCICAVDVAIAATTSAANAPVSLDAFFTVRVCLRGTLLMPIAYFVPRPCTELKMGRIFRG